MAEIQQRYCADNTRLKSFEMAVDLTDNPIDERAVFISCYDDRSGTLQATFLQDIFVYNGSTYASSAFGEVAQVTVDGYTHRVGNEIDGQTLQSIVLSESGLLAARKSVVPNTQQCFEHTFSLYANFSRDAYPITKPMTTLLCVESEWSELK